MVYVSLEENTIQGHTTQYANILGKMLDFLHAIPACLVCFMPGTKSKTSEGLQPADQPGQPANMLKNHKAPRKKKKHRMFPKRAPFLFVLKGSIQLQDVLIGVIIMYVHVCMYVCMSVCLYVCLYVCMYV